MRALRAAAIGSVVGFLLLAMIALLAKLIGHHLASTTAETLVFATLLAVAFVTTLGRPAQMRKARVPIRRAVPPQWWPSEAEDSGIIAICLGGPIVVAAAVGAIVFR